MITPSAEALSLCQESEVIDLHLDTLIPYRLFGYHPFQRHRNFFGRHFFGHSDLPRMNEGGLSGGMWSITTNPFRFSNARWQIFLRNLTHLQRLCHDNTDKVQLVRSFSEYRSAGKKHKIFAAIQGGNSISGAPNGLLDIPDNLITRITLIHLTPSVYGNTSSPAHWLHPFKGLKDAGKILIEQLNQQHVFLDLAHAHPQTFWDSLDVHNPEHPVLVTHTGVQGVRKHWRNLDNKQIRAIAQRGGIIGIMFATNFLKHSKDNTANMVLNHLEHLIDIGGEKVASLGSDFDGAISTPTNLRSANQYPILVQGMLERGWSEERIKGILGQNFLDVFQEYCP